MQKVELEIIGLHHSHTQQNSYAVLLGELGGIRRIPVVIGPFEAQSIAVALEKLQPQRPLTHDLVKNLLDKLDVQLKEIIISDLQDGIFFAQLVCEQGDSGDIQIDSRTSDALALAVRFRCPIFTYDFILEQAGIIMDPALNEPAEEGEEAEDPSSAPTTSSESSAFHLDIARLKKNELEDLLNKLIADEDYEKAIKVRDELTKREERGE